MLLAAALARPQVAAIQQALDGRDAAELLGRAEAAEIVTILGADVAFTHPVLASGIYASAAGPERRAAHRRLASVAGGAEERARHLALAATDAEPQVVAALDDAARDAQARGAPADAAELYELAIRLGAEQPARLISAADAHLVAGDFGQAEALAERARSMAGAGPERARALGLLGTIRMRDNSYADAAPLLEQALAEAGPGVDRVTLMLAFVFVLTNTARLHDAPAHCQAAVDEAERVGDDGLLAEALVVRAMIGFLVGNGVAESDLVHALALEDPERPTPIMLTPSAIAGRIWGWTGRFEESRELSTRYDSVRASVAPKPISCT